MRLTLLREPSTLICTPGVLFVDGRFECFSLEDVIREWPGQPVDKWKIKGATAIPSGIYDVDITPSPRFKRDLPIIYPVPGFDGIRIHPGNRAADTEGCLLVGRIRKDIDPTVDGIEQILESKLAFDALFQKLKDALAQDAEIKIEIRNWDAPLYSSVPLARSA